MADLSSGGLLSGAPVQWTSAAAQHSLATPIITRELAVDPGDATTSDLLQQAMNEVSFDTSGAVSYVEHGGEVVYVQEDGRLVSLNGVIVSGSMAVVSDPEATGVVVSGKQDRTVEMDVSRVLYNSENPSVICEYMPTDPGAITVTAAGDLTYDNSVEDSYSVTDVRTSQAACPIQISNVRSISSIQTSVEEQNTTDDVPSGAVETDSSPLGSSQNPIRIIQRGNQYTVMQHLTPDQLSQILQVIQEQLQHAQTKNPLSSGSAILCNPDSGSQVVYRITTSSSSTGGDGCNNGTVVRMVTNAEHSHQKRIIRKRRKDEEVRLVGIELSRQEKEERKKHRPRTRSGRVSKPPQYMVKDYKHIHPVDYDEDYDDSDGGYSDFKHSGDEADSEDRQSKDDNLLDVDHSGRFVQLNYAVCILNFLFS